MEKFDSKEGTMTELESLRASIKNEVAGREQILIDAQKRTQELLEDVQNIIRDHRTRMAQLEIEGQKELQAHFEKIAEEKRKIFEDLGVVRKS